VESGVLKVLESSSWSEAHANPPVGGFPFAVPASRLFFLGFFLALLRILPFDIAERPMAHGPRPPGRPTPFSCPVFLLPCLRSYSAVALVGVTAVLWGEDVGKRINLGRGDT
jgi:hypothetical protein